MTLRSGPYERVADYPRPPALVPCSRQIRVDVFGKLLCSTEHCMRVLETYHPPSYYIPPESFDLSLLEPAAGHSFCEWKGIARYFDLVVQAGTKNEQRRRKALWQYSDPTEPFRAIAGWFSLYPSRVDRCLLDGEPVRPQPGDFYGGWISGELIGPFKGDPGHPELI